MPNSKLINKDYQVPDKVLNLIKNRFNTIKDTSSDGYKKAKNIVNKKSLSYQQIKNLKSYFDNYKKSKPDDEYKLLGGETTKKWVNSSLSNDREGIKQTKTAKMRNGVDNAFIKTHEKDNENSNVTKSNGGVPDMNKSMKMRNIMANDVIYQEQHKKEIDEILYLIEYLNK